MKKVEILKHIQHEITELYERLHLQINQDGRELLCIIKGLERAKEIVELSRRYQYGKVHYYEGRWYHALHGMPGKALGIGDLQQELSTLSKEGWELVTYQGEKEGFLIRKEIWGYEGENE